MFIDEFGKQAKEHPEHQAVRAFGISISYGELDYKSTLLAIYLKNLKLSDDEVLGIYDNGSVNHFVAMIACIKVGIPFINLDVKAPKIYNAEILSLLSVHKLITGSYTNDNNFSCFQILDVEKILKNPLPDCVFDNHYSISDVAYIVATSGTTGKPKLIAKKFEALDVSFKQMKKTLPFLFFGAVQQTAPLHYAFGLDQTLIFLCAGVTICVDAQDDYVNIKNYYSCIEKNQAQTIFWASPVLKLLSRQPQLFKGMPYCLKHIVSGGEPLVVSAPFLFELRNRDISLLNNYGCTEIGTMFFSPVNIPLLEIQEYNRIPIGQPLPGFDATLSDKGELLIYTEKFFNRYYKNPRLMSSKFNFVPNEKVCFYTEDIAEQIGENFYIVGRLDNCVNIRGFRVEIELVERYISQILGGTDCCVISKKNDYDEISLICFYQRGIMEVSQILRQLKEILPDYMIPSNFVVLTEIPKMNNGKIDRRKLLNVYEKNLEARGKKEYDIESFEQRIKKMLEEMLKKELPRNFYERTFHELGLDSLSFVDFICKVEFIEKIMIDDKILADKRIKTVGDMIDLMRSKK